MAFKSAGQKAMIVNEIDKASKHKHKQKSGKKGKSTEHPNIEPQKRDDLKGLHIGAKAIPPKPKSKTKKSKPKKSNIPNPY